MAKNVSLNLLPDKSKRLYTSAYNTFKKWHKENNTNSFCEEVLLAYFDQLSKKYVPSSLWATYSMLKCTINTYDHIDISRYTQLTSFLKKSCVGYRPKKSQVFSQDNIFKFLNEAPDHVYLCEKVALIFGIFGSLRREEFVNITVDDVRKLEDDVLLVQIPKTKNYLPRSFTITDALFHYCWKYIQARPANCQINRFFLRYTKGKCIEQSIGINKFATMPRDIAEYLKLSDAKYFTGHSLRRTSASLLVDAGDDLTTLQQQGASFALGYIASSINNKKKIYDPSGINIHKSANTTNVVPSTVSEIDYVASNSVVNTTIKIEEIQGTTPETATTPIFEKIQNSRISFASTSKPNHEANAFSDCGESISGSSRETEGQPQEPKFSCFDNLNIGLHIQHSTDQDAARQNCVFNNCNVYINGSNNTFIFNNCNIENKAVKTENNGHSV